MEMNSDKDNKNKPSYYSIMTADVRYSNDLSCFDKILYSDITALCNKNGYCTATNGYFSDVFNKSNKTISRSISNLVSNGFVESVITREESEFSLRKLYIKDTAQVDRDKNVHIPLDKNVHIPLDKNVQTPMVKNVQHNNINNNNINNNNILVEYESFTDFYNCIITKELLKSEIKQDIDFYFDVFWGFYPKKQGKKDALRHFKRTVKSKTDLVNFCKAFINYAAYMEQKGTLYEYLKMASSFCNQWDDWVDFKLPKDLDSGKNLSNRTKANISAVNEFMSKYSNQNKSDVKGLTDGLS